jgi:hypothetical protein
MIAAPNMTNLLLINKINLDSLKLKGVQGQYNKARFGGVLKFMHKQSSL